MKTFKIKKTQKMYHNPKIIHLIAAARPNFMKIAPLYHSLKCEAWADPKIIHTGQHYDRNMSDAFFQDLELPSPDIHLEVGSGSHAEQTGQVMIAYEKLLIDQPPDLVIVVGDVNSTLAASLASAKLGICVSHLEAGLRSFDRSMPEEINRIVTDQICNYLWTPSTDADANLLAEGIPKERFECVGNIMIDALELTRPKIEASDMTNKMGLTNQSFAITTLHRPSNVDRFDSLNKIVNRLIEISKQLPIVFPIHPRTKKQLEKFNLMPLLEKQQDIMLNAPLPYISFMNLVFNADMIITDSGGIQEETTYLGIPCLTLRPNTERPITIEQGTNQLCTIDNIEVAIAQAMTIKRQTAQKPDLWDGKTAHRVVQSIDQILA